MASRRDHLRKSVAAAWLVAYLAILFGLTLGLFSSPGAPMNLVPFRTMAHDFGVGGREFVVNFLGNLADWMPLGFLLPTLLGARCSILRVALLGLSLSLLIEVLQGFSGRRVADVDDLILNTIGAVMGYAGWTGLRRCRFRRSGGQKA